MASYFIGQGATLKYAVAPGPATTPICVESVTIETRSDLQDVTTTCSGGFIDRIGGIKDATLTFTGFYDGTDPILSDIQPELFYAMEVTFPSGDKYSGEFGCQSVNIENPAKTTVKYTVTMLSDGVLTFTAAS